MSLVALLLRSDGFDHFRCDRNISLGINLGSMGKVPRSPTLECLSLLVCGAHSPLLAYPVPSASQVLKCCNNDDIVTLKADDNGDSMTFMFENQSQDRISDFELKLMDIDSEHLGIPGLATAGPLHPTEFSPSWLSLRRQHVLAIRRKPIWFRHPCVDRLPAPTRRDGLQVDDQDARKRVPAHLPRPPDPGRHR